jgi:N,N'-diacetylchitobiose transport system substrate-binding protein
MVNCEHRRLSPAASPEEDPVRTRSLAVLAGLLALTATAACGGGGSGSPSASGSTVTVWLMDGDLSDRTVAAIDDAFTKRTGAKVDVQIQQWADINTKLSTALAQDNPPDVLDIGNTDVPLYAATGALADLTAHRAALSRDQTWLPGLVGPATVAGKLYAAPLFAGNRAVIYDKQVWAAAGITAPPTSFAELTTDLDRIRAANPDPAFSPFYLPGKYWHGAVQFVWDAGGQLATDTGGQWRGALASAAAQQGLATWKSFQNTYSAPASRDTDNQTPDQAALFADGKAAAVLDSSVTKILKDNPALATRIGTFPFPSRTAGRNQPVFLGGSDLAIAANSHHQDLALDYLATATDPAVQRADIAGVDGWTPVSTQIIDSAAGLLPATSAAFLTAAKRSVATPATPGWATIEGDRSINDFFGDIATGRQTPAAAAASFDQHLDQALNTKP